MTVVAKVVPEASFNKTETPFNPVSVGSWIPLPFASTQTEFPILPHEATVIMTLSVAVHPLASVIVTV